MEVDTGRGWETEGLCKMEKALAMRSWRSERREEGGSKFRLFEHRSSTCVEGMSRAEEPRAIRSTADDSASNYRRQTDMFLLIL